MGPVGSSLATSGANWLSDVLGMGDYKIESNSLVGAQGVPKFQTSKHSTRITHREYLGDIQGSIGFALQSFAVNPGQETTFPWLSNLAYAYQQYKLHGMLFEYVSTCGDAIASNNNSLGTVIMATQYNAGLPNFLNKAEMDQYEYTCSSKPSSSLIHPVECDPALNPLQHLYVRSGTVPVGSDIRLFDLGTFQIATSGMQAAVTIGELWVTYDVEFFKPRIQPGGAYPGQFFRSYGTAYGAPSFPSTVVNTGGTLAVTQTTTTITNDTITFSPTITAGRFLVVASWRGAATVIAANIATTLSNCTAQLLAPTAPFSALAAPNSGATSNNVIYETVVTINGYSAAGSTICITAGTLPATPSFCLLTVTAIPLTDNYV